MIHRAMEALEARRLFAITLSDAGVLTITGTAGDDKIVINPNSSSDVWRPGEPRNYGITVGSSSASYAFEEVKRIIIRAGAGNDIVDLGLYTMEAAIGSHWPVSVPAIVRGEEGNDRLYAGERRTILRGNAGNDTLIAEQSHHGAVLDGGTGNDQLLGALGSDRIIGGSGNDRINCRGGFDTVFGNSGHDSITGGEGPDLIFGGSGNDTITGGSGNDLLFGGRDTDYITGGLGADQFSFVVDHRSEWLDYLAGTDKPPIDILE